MKSKTALGLLLACFVLVGGTPVAIAGADGEACLDAKAKVPDDCRNQVRSLMLERDALKEELEQLKTKIELDVAEGGELQSLAADARSTEGYGQSRWGMNVDEVKKLYPKARGKKGKGLLAAGQTVADTAASLRFGFLEQRLKEVDVEFGWKKYQRIDNLVEEYSRLEDLLRAKYGAPLMGDSEPVGMTRAQSEELARVITGDQLWLSTTWQTAKTKITLTCQGKGRQAQMRIGYESREMLQEEQKRQLKDL